MSKQGTGRVVDVDVGGTFTDVYAEVPSIHGKPGFRTIKLLSEDRSKGEPEVVVTWELIGAMPMKWTGPSLNAKGGGDVAMEELVLSVENVRQA